MQQRLIRLGVVLVALSLSACVVVPRGGRHARDDDGEPVAVATLPPPAPVYEMVPALPFAGAIWVGGYWGWAGGRHQWVPGHYQRPRVGFVWSPYRWLSVGGGWHLRGGWVRH